MKLSANISTMFTHLPLLERFQAAGDAGFQAVECQKPYEASAQDLAEAAKRAGVPLIQINTPAGDFAAGERGIAAAPGRRDDFLKHLHKAMEYTRVTGAKLLHLQPGKVADGAQAQAEEIFLQNLSDTADAAAAEGVTVLLEPINSVDQPGYFYSTTAEALRLMDIADRSNVRLQYDVYHMQIMQGDLARTIERLLPRIGHIQIADNPGRHEPGTGEINYPWLLGRIDALGYNGFVGCEYFPAGDTAAGLGWAKAYL